jgi:hypothetical protein
MMVIVDAPGEFVVPVGAVLGNVVCLNPVGSGDPLNYACFAVDAWGLRVAGGGTVDVKEKEASPAPAEYRTYQSYPNPFNPVCTIRYEIPVAGRVSLRIFDVKGSVVKVLVDGLRQPGEYSEVWDGRGNHGRKLASGVYFYELEAGDFKSTRKMVLLR